MSYDEVQEQAPVEVSATEDLRNQAKQTLLAATSSGKLDEALARMKKSKEPAEKVEEDATASAPSTETLRNEAKQTLLLATTSGKLDEALSNLKKSKESAATRVAEASDSTVLSSCRDTPLVIGSPGDPVLI